MGLSWNELPPDFLTEPFNALFRRVSFADALAICRYEGTSQTLVLLDKNAEKEAQEHLRLCPVEAGGLLLGKTYVNAGEIASPLKFIVAIQACICAKDAQGTPTALRMEPHLWTQANNQRQSDEFVVGWFHSHPNLGAFFSGTDRRTQASFFADPHKLGWVVDPHRKEEAWFSGGDSVEIPPKMIVRGYF
jgi:proteasome lid subunit RPN8/RPN11